MSLVLPVMFSHWLVSSDLGDIATNCMHQTGFFLSMFLAKRLSLPATSAEASQAKI